jgi:hypothetical protein
MWTYWKPSMMPKPRLKRLRNSDEKLSNNERTRDEHFLYLGFINPVSVADGMP